MNNNIGRKIRMMSTTTWWNEGDVYKVVNEDDTWLYFDNHEQKYCAIEKYTENRDFRYVPLSEHQEYYQENREALLKQKKDYRSQLKNDVLGILGGKCRNCGYSDLRALDVKGGTPRGKSSYTAYYNQIWKIVEMYPNHNYYLLCANCQRLEKESE